LNKKTAFSASEEDSSAEETDGENITFSQLDEKADVHAENVALPAPKREQGFHTAPAPAAPINGVTWKKQRQKNRRDIKTLNNGEPVSFAIRKMIKESMIILVCIGVVFGFFFAKEFVVDKLSDNAYGSLSVSTRYNDPVGLANIAPVINKDSDGYACLQTVCAWAGGATPNISTMLAAHGGKDITNLPDGMEKELTRALPNKVVTQKVNLANYSLLTQIYDSLKAQNPVLVSCTPEKHNLRSYAIVTAMDTKNATVAMLYADGKAATLSFADFIASTRFENYKKKPLPVRLGFALGLYTKNTAFFFTDKER
ncbi:MAG: hypothetical protein RSC76_10160, partial [Oscillospiraceae bacterium]